MAKTAKVVTGSRAVTAIVTAMKGAIAIAKTASGTGTTVAAIGPNAIPWPWSNRKARP